MTDIENGRIASTTLGIEGHGILSSMIHIKCEGGGQGFGGYALDEPQKDNDGNFLGRIGTDFGMEYINRILKVLKVDKWESLPGTPLRVRRDTPRGDIIAIGHFINDDWFEPKRDLANLIPAED